LLIFVNFLFFFQIYHDDFLLKELSFAHLKKIILQKIDNPNGLKPFEKTDVQLTVREWDSENWKVSKPIDLHFKKQTTCLEFAGILYDYFTHINVKKLN